jgi:hypothetical protein
MVSHRACRLYVLFDQALPISSEGVCECFTLYKGCRGEQRSQAKAAYTVVYSCIPEVTTQQDKVSEV